MTMVRFIFHSLLPLVLMWYLFNLPLISTAPRVLTEMVATSNEFDKLEPCLLFIKCDKTYVKVSHPRYGVHKAKIKREKGSSRKIIYANAKVRVWVDQLNPSVGLLVDPHTSEDIGAVYQPPSYAIQLIVRTSIAILLLLVVIGSPYLQARLVWHLGFWMTVMIFMLPMVAALSNPILALIFSLFSIRKLHTATQAWRWGQNEGKVLQVDITGWRDRFIHKVGRCSPCYTLVIRAHSGKLEQLIIKRPFSDIFFRKPQIISSFEI